MTKRPAFQFYPGDWLRDTGLRSCSAAARGLWMDILCFMHEGSPYGYLKVNHKVILAPNLARMCGLTLQETEGCLAELAEAGVFETDEEGVIFSRRMIRDEELRNKRAACGHLGGNPTLKDNQKVGVCLSTEVKQKPTPSSSSSSSSSIITSSNEEVGADRKKTYLLDEEFWSEMRRHYPNVDVDAESRKMDAWLLARPGRKKTRQFVINWLNKVEPALAPAKAKEVDLTW
jgi:hypothetical protein